MMVNHPQSFQMVWVRSVESQLAVGRISDISWAAECCQNWHQKIQYHNIIHFYPFFIWIFTYPFTILCIYIYIYIYKLFVLVPKSFLTPLRRCDSGFRTSFRLSHSWRHWFRGRIYGFPGSFPKIGGFEHQKWQWNGDEMVMKWW
jgi:hypothetical protein